MTFILVAYVCVRNANLKQNKGVWSVVLFSNMRQYIREIETYKYVKTNIKQI